MLSIRKIISKLSKIDNVEVISSVRFNKNYLGTKGKLESITLNDENGIEILGRNGLNINFFELEIKEILEVEKSITISTPNIQVIFRW